MSEQARFPWEAPSATIFNVWMGQPELAWARRAWEALERQGLTLFSNEIERSKVLIRALTLGTIYREFCDIAFEDAWDPEYLWWADEVGLSQFRVAQLVGTAFELDSDDEDSTLFESAITHLIDESRGEIYSALCKEFGGEAMLFCSLWSSPTPIDAGESEIDYAEEDDSDPKVILSTDLTFQKMHAYAWVMEGMPRYR